MNENVREVPESESKNTKKYIRIGQGTFQGALYRNIFSKFQPAYNLIDRNTVYNITGTPARQLEEIENRVAGHIVKITLKPRESAKYDREYLAITHIENLGLAEKKPLTLEGFSETEL
jgi:hypothetical protein